MAITATLGGFPIIGTSPVVWSLTAGVHPAQAQFDLKREDADSLFLLGRDGLNGKIKLEISFSEEASGKEKRISVDGLSVLGTDPADNPFLLRVLVADQRWTWSRKHVRGIFNLRRRIGTKRQKFWNDPLLDPTESKFRFNPLSLNGDRLWTAKELLIEIVHRVDPSATVVFEPKSLTLFDSVEIENLEMDESGESAVLRAMSFIGGIDLYIDELGRIVFYNVATGNERFAVEALGPEIVGRGLTLKSDNSAIRPKEVHVFFTREVELRFDVLEAIPIPFPSGGTRLQDAVEPLRAENVIPIPDPSLDVLHLQPGAGGISIIDTGIQSQGTWIPVDDAFESWGNMPRVNLPMDHAFVQKAFIPENDLWGPLGLLGNLDPQADWTARVSVVQQHYRQTFRINQRWMDRIISLRPYLISTIDQATGARANAPVYSDYFFRASMKSMLIDRNAQYWGSNVSGYPTGALNSQGVATITQSDRPAPARLTVVDDEQGIVNVSYLMDVLRLNDLILPSKVNLTTMPTENILGAIEDPIAFDCVADENTLPSLSPSHKLAFILTAVPLGPNNIEQFQRIRVRPGDADLHDVLAPAAREGLSNAKGPIWEVHIGAGIETARVQYRDDRVDDITAIFFNDGSHAANVDDLVVNLESTSGGAASLRVIAVAEAARIYARLTDRVIGAKSGLMNPEIRPVGTLKTVTHTLAPDGIATTEIDLPPEPPEIKLINLLDSSTRGVILRLAQGKK